MGDVVKIEAALPLNRAKQLGYKETALEKYCRDFTSLPDFEFLTVHWILSNLDKWNPYFTRDIKVPQLHYTRTLHYLPRRSPYVITADDLTKPLDGARFDVVEEYYNCIKELLGVSDIVEEAQMDFENNQSLSIAVRKDTIKVYSRSLQPAAIGRAQEIFNKRFNKENEPYPQLENFNFSSDKLEKALGFFSQLYEQFVEIPRRKAEKTGCKKGKK